MSILEKLALDDHLVGSKSWVAASSRPGICLPFYLNIPKFSYMMLDEHITNSKITLFRVIPPMTFQDVYLDIY